MHYFLLFLTAFLSSQEHEWKRFGAFGPVEVQLRCTEPTSIYLESDFPLLYSEPAIIVQFTNSSSDGAALECRGTVVDFYGNTRSVRPAKTEILLKAGESKEFSFSTDKSRGAFTFQLTVAGKGPLESLPEERFSRVFVVAPEPHAGCFADSFFRVEKVRAWRPFTGELCRRMGIKVVRTFIDPESSKELFDGWVTAARLRDLCLVPVFHQDRFPDGGGERFMNATPRLSGASMDSVSWKQGTIRLSPSPASAAFLNTVSNRMHDRYALEGTSTQLAYVLAHASGESVARLTELGLRSPQVGERLSWPYFLRRLDKAGRLARSYDKKVSLCAYNSSGDVRPQASALVSCYVLASLAGYSAVSPQGEGGIIENRGRERFALSAVHSTMSYFLGERVPVADCWHRQNLLYGCVFAGPGDRPAGIEREEVLSVRDAAMTGEKEKGEQFKIAVLFSDAPAVTGEKSELFIPASEDLSAFTIMGTPIGRRSQSGLVVPFGRDPVYVVTYRLSVGRFVRKLRESVIRGLDLVHVAFRPFNGSVLSCPALEILVDNSNTRPIEGSLTVKGDGWEPDLSGGLSFSLEPGEMRWLQIPMKKSLRRKNGCHPFDVVFSSTEGAKKFRVVVPIALVRSLTPAVDGDLSDWNKYPSLMLDDAASYLQWQSNAQPVSVSDAPLPAEGDASLWTGYDHDSFYFALKVRDQCRTVWDGTASAEGLRSALTGSAVQIAFGVEQDGNSKQEGEPGDPWAWKGMRQDTDYLYLAAPVRNGTPLIVSLHEPEMVWGESFLQGARKVPNARLTVQQDGPFTVYEGAIPREHLKGMKGKPKRLRIGVVCFAGGKTLQLAESFAIPRYLASGGSFLPETDAALLPNLIVWGIE